MAERLMVCEDCGKIFRVKYDSGKDSVECPSCDSANVVGVYRQHNVKERA